jgi:hypothetical protein
MTWRSEREARVFSSRPISSAAALAVMTAAVAKASAKRRSVMGPRSDMAAPVEGTAPVQASTRFRASCRTALRCAGASWLIASPTAQASEVDSHSRTLAAWSLRGSVSDPSSPSK